jgi:hypothetical protein
VEGQSKLNQIKSDEDHVAVANRLAGIDDTASRRLAQKMCALRPKLRYDVSDAQARSANRMTQLATSCSGRLLPPGRVRTPIMPA